MTSQFRGVTYSKKSAKWQAAINMSGRHVHLGTHVSEQEAAIAFDKAALIVRGDKAKINFPLAHYRDEFGNLIVDQGIALKLQLLVHTISHMQVASTTEKGTGGGASRKRLRQNADAGLPDNEEGADGDGHSPGLPAFNLGMHSWTQLHGLANQAFVGEYGMPQPQHSARPSSRASASQPPPPGSSPSPWPCLTSIVSCCVPAGAKLRGLIPHAASRTMGVLYDLAEAQDDTQQQQQQGGTGAEGEQQAAAQVGAALWSSGSMLCRQAHADEQQAREYIQHYLQLLGSMGAGTGVGGMGQAQQQQQQQQQDGAAWQQQQQQQPGNLLLQVLAGMTAGSVPAAGAPGGGGWPQLAQGGAEDGTDGVAAAMMAAMASGDVTGLANALAAAAAAFPQQQAAAAGTGGMSSVELLTLLAAASLGMEGGTAAMGLDGGPGGAVAALGQGGPEHPPQQQQQQLHELACAAPLETGLGPEPFLQQQQHLAGELLEQQQQQQAAPAAATSAAADASATTPSATQAAEALRVLASMHLPLQQGPCLPEQQQLQLQPTALPVGPQGLTLPGALPLFQEGRMQ